MSEQNFCLASTDPIARKTVARVVPTASWIVVMGPFPSQNGATPGARDDAGRDGASDGEGWIQCKILRGARGRES